MSSRLIITKMVLENFKSYAGVKEIGPFHKSFSSIVGPNGSGKSNVIDAMLFVFGKRAKQLRLNRVSELIHRSSDFPDLGFATVTVHFASLVEDDDPNSFDIVPGSEFTISRTAYTDNHSKYQINGQNSSMTEVTDLLKDYGVDLDNNRFLILQGEVEQISMMKPKAQNAHEEGLLEYLEDIIGSNTLVEDIQAAALEVDELNAQRTEQLHRVRLSEKEKENLEDAKEEAFSYLRTERTIRHKKALVASKKIHRAARKRDEVVERRDRAQERMEEQLANMEANELKLKEVETSYNEETKTFNEANRHLQSVADEFACFEKEDVKFKESLKHLKAKRKRVKASLTKEETKLAENEEKKEEVASRLDGMREDVQECEQVRDREEQKLEQLHEQLQNETADLRDEITDLQRSSIPLREQVVEMRGDISTTQTQIDLVQAKVNEGQHRVDTLTNELDQVTSDIDTKTKELKKLKKAYRQDEDKLTEQKESLHQLKDQENATQDRLSSIIQQLEEVKQSYQSAANKNQAVNAIMEASSGRGELAGIGVIGRLGDLGEIDERFDIAATMSSGALNHIVVETTSAGMACMNFLRNHQAGRASFIVLEEMGSMARRMLEPISIPDEAMRLFDLIHVFDDHHKAAFYFAFKNTLVTRDLDSAVRVAYEDGSSAGAKWRVITEDGQLIEVSGAMSGGGRQVKRGGMLLKGSSSSSSSSRRRRQRSAEEGSKSEVEDMKEMEREVEQFEQKLERVQTRKRDIEGKIRQLESSLVAMGKEIDQLTFDLDELNEKQEELSEQLDRARENIHVSEEDKKELKRLQRVLAAQEREITGVEEQLATMESRMKDLQEEVVARGGPKLRNQQNKYDQAVHQLEQLSSELSNAEVDISTCESAIAKANKAMTKYTEQLAETETDIERVTEERQEMEEKAAVVLEEYEQAKESVSTMENELNAMKREYDELKKEMSRMKTIEQDMRLALEEQDRKVAEIDQVLDIHGKELKRLIRSQNDDLREFGSLDEERLGKDPLMQTLFSEAEEEKEKGMMEEEEEEKDDDDQQESTYDRSIHLCNQAIPAHVPPSLLQALDEDDLSMDIRVLEEERDQLRSQVNLTALEEYRKKEQEYMDRVNELETVTQVRNEKRRAWDTLRRERLDRFLDGFSQITLKLKEMYQMITLGGDAELELVDSLDPFSEGVVFSVRPPKKSWKQISNLSGGEKTLASLALVFALHHYKPTPLYVMDEIDAALDFKNVSIVANYIKERTRNAQFIIISLRNNMFELADRLVGIYKTHDVTKTVTINPATFEQRTPLMDRTNRGEEEERVPSV